MHCALPPPTQVVLQRQGCAMLKVQVCINGAALHTCLYAALMVAQICLNEWSWLPCCTSHTDTQPQSLAGHACSPDGRTCFTQYLWLPVLLCLL